MKVPKLFKSVRYSLAGINIIFLLSGFLLLILGITVLLIFQDYELFITDRFTQLPKFVIASAVVILLTSGLGFYGAYSEQFYFIAAYVGLLVVILVFEISMCIVGYGLYHDTVAEITPLMRSGVQQYETRRDVAVLWDTVQMSFECCGARGLSDWGRDRIPVSCCHIDYGTISPFHCIPSLVYPTPCSTALGDWLGYHAYVIGVIALVLTCLQIVIVGVAAWLGWRSRFEEVELES